LRSRDAASLVFTKRLWRWSRLTFRGRGLLAAVLRGRFGSGSRRLGRWWRRLGRRWCRLGRRWRGLGCRWRGPGCRRRGPGCRRRGLRYRSRGLACWCSWLGGRDMSNLGGSSSRVNLWWLRFNRGFRSPTGWEPWRWSFKFLLRWRDRFDFGRRL
jgi:hypothetical protein